MMSVCFNYGPITSTQSARMSAVEPQVLSEGELSDNEEEGMKDDKLASKSESFPPQGAQESRHEHDVASPLNESRSLSPRGRGRGKEGGDSPADVLTTKCYDEGELDYDELMDVERYDKKVSVDFACLVT